VEDLTVLGASFSSPRRLTNGQWDYLDGEESDSRGKVFVMSQIAENISMNPIGPACIQELTLLSTQCVNILLDELEVRKSRFCGLNG